MPINYLQLQPQIRQYGQDAVRANQDVEAKLRIALQLLHACGEGHPHNQQALRAALAGESKAARTALTADEPADAAFNATDSHNPYCLLAADGSQIIPDPHEALDVALVNISRIQYTPDSAQAPVVMVFSRFLKNREGQIAFDNISEDQVNLERDVEEMHALADGLPDTHTDIITIRDGALELFHEPRQSGDFEDAFGQYLEKMRQLHRRKVILAGYIDKPRADLVVSMLPFTAEIRQAVDLTGLSDLQLFFEILQPGQRSAIFELCSTSSVYYQDQLQLHFFYLNVGSSRKPWIARVEVPAWVAGSKTFVDALHQALLDQCRLMGGRPYPYLLHRAHEEALVSLEEKERLIDRLAFELGHIGMEPGQKSHKLSAKELQPRTRIKI